MTEIFMFPQTWHSQSGSDILTAYLNILISNTTCSTTVGDSDLDIRE